MSQLLILALLCLQVFAVTIVVPGHVLAVADSTTQTPPPPGPVNIVLATSTLVAWEGRTVASTNGSLFFDWVGVSARVSVTNNFTLIIVTLTDACIGGNKFVVRLSGEGLASLDIANFYTRQGTHDYVLFAAAGRSNFVGAVAEVTVIKAVEARFTLCYPENNEGLSIDSFSTDGIFVPPTVRTRRMEIIGDSITAGDLVFCADSMGNHFGTSNSLWADSHAVSYGSRLCTALGAICSTIAWGGMGLLANDNTTPFPTMPDVYKSALAWPVANRGPAAPLDHPFNFSSTAPPDAVLINLGTNDATFGRFNNATFTAAFVTRYIDFVVNITKLYSKPDITFFLGFGPMTEVYAPAVSSTITALIGNGIHAVAINYTLPNGARCACGHPSDADHLVMAQTALPVIKKVMGW